MEIIKLFQLIVSLLFKLLYKELSCICASNAIEAFSADNNLSVFPFAKTKTCTLCPSGSVASKDHTTCMKCPSDISTTTGDCVCPSGNKIVEKDSLGNYLSQKQCVQCPIGQYQGNTNFPIYDCAQCPPNMLYNNNTTPWTCECDTNKFISSGGECLDKVEATFFNTDFSSTSASAVQMSFAETTDPNVFTQETISQSDVIQYYYFKSGYKCLKELDNKSCQILANICVLQLYDTQSTACKLYDFINNLQKTIPNEE